MDACKEVYITVNQHGGTYNHLTRGFCLQFPPDCVTEATRIKCETSSSKTTLPSPAHPMEGLVSSIVQLGPRSLQLQKPFVMILLHCGVEKSKGYETKVKVFNEESGTWEEVKELPPESIPRVNILPSLKYIGIQLSKMAAVAVVSRLVTDTFEVPVSGCVVKSSVCDGVTLRFPIGAVSETFKGSLQVIPIPDHVKGNSEAIPTPILLFSGFGNVIFSEPVRIKSYYFDSHDKTSSDRKIWVEYCGISFDILRDISEQDADFLTLFPVMSMIYHNDKTSSDRKIWVDYCGITFDILREISEQDANLLRQLFEEQKVKDTIDGFKKRWYEDDGVEEFLSLLHKIPYNEVYEALNKPDQNTQDRLGHILNKIQYGHKITAETSLHNIPQELTNTISKMSTESIKDYNKFGQLLGLSEEVLKSLGSSHAVLSFWKENNKKTGKVADLLKALRECWAVDPAKQLAKTITEIASIGQTGDNTVSQASERESNREVTVTETQAAECEENSRVTVTKSQAAERKSNREVAITENRAAEHEDNSGISKKQYSGHWKDDPDSSDVYRMKSNPRGLMVIINIQKFAVDPTDENREELMKELTEREGSERDVDKLTDLFSGKLKFKVCTIIDKPRQELLGELRSFAEDSAYKDYDCLAVCIMSHGKDDKFYAYDGKEIKVSAVYNMFSNSMCEVFRFKPKLFFIQACRGQRGSKFVVADGPSVESSAQHPHTESKDADMADMLIAYSSFEDYTSYRHSEEGSYFIQSLVQFFREYADSEHVEEILTRVKKEVHRLIQETSEGRTQVPAPVSTLLKKLYFWPGMDFNK